MKAILLLSVLLLGFSAQANGECASNKSEIDNIAGLTSKVNLFGSWTGTLDGDDVFAEFTEKSNGAFSGKLQFGDKVYGPTGVSVCDYGNDEFALIVYWQQADLVVISKKVIEITLPFGNQDTVRLTKQ